MRDRLTDTAASKMATLNSKLGIAQERISAITDAANNMSSGSQSKAGMTRQLLAQLASSNDRLS